ncbi:sugar ABC transporter permease [uncultured Sphaerochaeta sp.]|uniref:carbohydrate ABC transporter permease n=1 Tax=uncultured Sphaerochaeta sp. TaxID=886478 RepID=UPI002A0A3A90|nr:sugar ABC transporter permease [uncultured Sphaerochaeta sp.]
MKKRKSLSEGYYYILPWFIGFLIFGLYPLVSSLYFSFTDFTMFNKPKLIGFSNYVYMFTSDREFFPSLLVTFKYVLFSVPMKIVSALFFAVLLNRKLRYINLFTTIYYLPSILGASVSISILWRFMFSLSGLVNTIFSKIGMKPIPFLEDPRYALFSISLLVVWSFGSSMVIFLAGLKQIPKELYEAASIDGASKFKEFFLITLPLLTPSLFFNLIMQLINSFQSFTSAFVITHGGPMKSTYLYMMKLYNEAFSNFKMGYASALSWFLFLVVLSVTYTIFKKSDKFVYYME